MSRIWTELLLRVEGALEALGPALGLVGREASDGGPLPLGRPLSRLERLLPAVLGGPSDLERRAERMGIATRVVTVGGRRRRYHLHVPHPGVAGASGAPLVLALHGGNGNALRFLHGVGALAMARQHGFVVAAPQGWGGLWRRQGSWNADSVTRLGLAERRRINDVRFLEAVIGSVEAEVGTNPSRVYVMGLSKGGMMAYRLACGRPGGIAAVAVVAGTMSTDLCPEGAAVPLLHIHGSQDENVPLEGGRGRHSAPGADWPEVARGVNLFRRANGCTGKPEVNRVAPDTVCRTYRGARGGGDVQFCLVEGGGHDWPGATSSRRRQRRGRGGYASPHFKATEHIARFFLAH